MGHSGRELILIKDLCDEKKRLVDTIQVISPAETMAICSTHPLTSSFACGANNIV